MANNLKQVETGQSHTTLGAVLLVGFLAAIGKMLASGEELTIKVVFGRAIVSTLLGLSSTLLWLRFPDVPPEVILGGTAFICSIGTSGLEQLIQRYIPRK